MSDAKAPAVAEYEELAAWLDERANFYPGGTFSEVFRFAAAALRALTRIDDEDWARWYTRTVPDALALADPLRERMSKEATRCGESKESSR